MPSEDDTFKALHRSPWPELREDILSWYRDLGDKRMLGAIIRRHNWTYNEFNDAVTEDPFT